jgi:hypothetical protein
VYIFIAFIWFNSRYALFSLRLNGAAKIFIILLYDELEESVSSYPLVAFNNIQKKASKKEDICSHLL